VVYGAIAIKSPEGIWANWREGREEEKEGKKEGREVRVPMPRKDLGRRVFDSKIYA